MKFLGVAGMLGMLSRTVLGDVCDILAKNSGFILPVSWEPE